MAQEIARFPQSCVHRRSVYLQQGLSVRDALEREWGNSIGVVELEGAAGAVRFAKGAGRHGDFGNTSHCGARKMPEEGNDAMRDPHWFLRRRVPQPFDELNF